MIMNYRKLYGGTPVGDGSLCDSCLHAQVVLGHSKVERITICDYPFQPMRVPFRVLVCSVYADKRLPDVEQMEKIAIDLTWVKASRPAGFQADAGCTGDSGHEEKTLHEPHGCAASSWSTAPLRKEEVR